MIDLEAEFDVADAEAAILLTYAVGLTHFEREILPPLLEGSGRPDVAIFCDAEQYAETFGESGAPTGAGVDYHLHPVWLGGGAFHPKVYLLFRPDGVRAVVASANLTVYGLRHNIEIADRLELQDGGEGDTRAFRALAELLAALPLLDPSLPFAARTALDDGVRRIRALLPDDAPDAGPHLLHSASAPLFAQRRALVPAVRSVSAVTPFFDRGALALREFERAYAPTSLDVVTSPGASHSLDGERVARDPLSARVFVTRSLAGETRRLHAKLLRLQAADADWVVAGSANLTAPAWLHGAGRSGNLEAITMRQASPGAAASLFDALDTEPANWRDFRWVPDPDLAGSVPALLPLTAATLLDDVIEVRSRDARLLDAGLAAWVEGRTGRFPLPVLSSQSASGVSVLRLGVGSGVRLSEDPMVLTVEVGAGKPGHATGRAWLHQPDLLGRTGWQRRTASLATAWATRGSLTDSETQAFGDALLEIAADLFQHAADAIAPESGAGSGQRPAKPKTEGSLDVADMVRLDGPQHRAHHSTQEQSRSLLARLLDALMASRPDVGDDGDDDWDEPGGGEVGGGQPGRPSRRDPQHERRGHSRDTVSGLDRAFRASLERWSAASLTGERVRDAARFVEVSLRGMVHFELRFARQQRPQLARRMAEDALLTLRHAFSIEGIEESRPVGWFVRAWCDDATHEAAVALLADERLRGALLSLAGAIAAHCDRLGVAAPGRMSHVLAGLCVLSGRTALMDEADLGGALGEAVERIAAEAGTELSAAEILDRLKLPMDDSTLPVLAAVRVWAPVLWPADGGPDPAAVHAGLKLVARSVAAGRPAPIATLNVQAEGAYCGECSMRLSEHLRQAVAGGERPIAQCETCGRFLVPFHHNSAVTRRVLTHFLPDLGGA
jgi:hypothetical protein